jgi:hypothetical protein
MTSPLRPALLANAGLSIATGLLMVAAPGTVSDWLGLNIAGWIRVFGIVLLGHAALIPILLSRMELRRVALLNLAAIAPYPLIMIGLVASGLIERSLGQGLALIDGALVGAIALAHAAGLRSPKLISHPQAA